MLNQDIPSDIQSFVASMMRDPSIRQNWLDDPDAAAKSMRAQGTDWLPGGEVEIKVVCNTADTFYMALPTIDESADSLVTDEQLALVQGGARAGSAGTAGCGGSASTAGTLNSTLSTGGSASSLSTAGTAAP